MRITCPSCAAAYEVPPTALKPGQRVRCARCAGEWVPSPVTPEPLMAARAEPEPVASPPPGFSTAAATGVTTGIATGINVTPPAPEPSQLRSATPRQAAPRRNVALRLAWAASIIAILLLGWGAYAERSAIMHVWPPSIRLYSALGLATGD